MPVEKVWCRTRYHQDAALLPVRMDPRDHVVVLMASRSGVLRWLLRTGLANTAHVTAVEPGFAHDENDLARLLRAAGWSEDATVLGLRRRVDDIVARRWDEVLGVAQHLCDARSAVLAPASLGLHHPRGHLVLPAGNTDPLGHRR
ncbi:MAG: hypothetical protein GXX79_16130 [Actinomycetales bacterium]|nr:hypothetical protein [Actinomycetales bacterium]